MSSGDGELGGAVTLRRGRRSEKRSIVEEDKLLGAREEGYREQTLWESAYAKLHFL